MVNGQWCLGNGAESVALYSHLGRPNGEEIGKVLYGTNGQGWQSGMPLKMVPSRSYFARTMVDQTVRRLKSSPCHLPLRLSIRCALGEGANLASHQ